MNDNKPASNLIKDWIKLTFGDGENGTSGADTENERICKFLWKVYI